MKQIIENFDFNELNIDAPSNELKKEFMGKDAQEAALRWCSAHIGTCDSYDSPMFEWKFDKDGLPDCILVSAKNGCDRYYIVDDKSTHLPCQLWFEPDWHGGSFEKYYTEDGQSYDVFLKPTKISLNLEGFKHLENFDGILNNDFDELTLSPAMKSLYFLKDFKINTLIIQENDNITNLVGLPKIKFRVLLMNNKNLLTLNGLRNDIQYVMITRSQPLYANIENETEFLKNYTIFGEHKSMETELKEIQKIKQKGSTLIFSCNENNINESINFTEIKNTKNNQEIFIEAAKDVVLADFDKFAKLFHEKLLKDESGSISMTRGTNTGNYDASYIYSFAGDEYFNIILKNDEIYVYSSLIPCLWKWIVDSEFTDRDGRFSHYERWPIDLLKVLHTFSTVKRKCSKILKFKHFSLQQSFDNSECRVVLILNNKNEKLLNTFETYNINLKQSDFYVTFCDEKSSYTWNDICTLFNINNPIKESINFNNVNVQTTTFQDELEKEIDYDKIYHDYLDALTQFLTDNSNSAEKIFYIHTEESDFGDAIWQCVKTGNSFSYKQCVGETSYGNRDKALFIRFGRVPLLKRWNVSRKHGWTDEGGTTQYVDFINMLEDLQNIKDSVQGGELLTYMSIAVRGNDNKMFVNIDNQHDYDVLNKTFINYSVARIKKKNIKINKSLITDKFNYKFLYKTLKINNNPYESLQEGFNFNDVKHSSNVISVFEDEEKTAVFDSIYQKIQKCFGYNVYYFCSLKNNTMFISRYQWVHKINIDNPLPQKYKESDLSRFLNIDGLFDPKNIQGTNPSFYMLDAILQFGDVLNAEHIRIEKAYMIKYTNTKVLSSLLNIAIEISGAYKINELYMCYFSSTNDDVHIWSWSKALIPGVTIHEFPDLSNNIGIIKANRTYTLNAQSLIFSCKNKNEGIDKFIAFVKMFDNKSFVFKMNNYDDYVMLLLPHNEKITLEKTLIDRIIGMYN